MASDHLGDPAQVSSAPSDAADSAFNNLAAGPRPAARRIRAPDRAEAARAQSDLAALVSWEAGKITQEALGEVQEMIDICDFAVGLSRQLYGLTIASERPGHRMMEQWHPLGPVGVITAFNFPVAVWAWNAMLALVCGDTRRLEAAEKTPLTAMACHRLVIDVLNEMPEVPDAAAETGHRRARTSAKRWRRRRKAAADLATGSVRMGRDVATTVASRLGRSLLELGGNNGMILAPSRPIWNWPSAPSPSPPPAPAGSAAPRCAG